MDGVGPRKRRTTRRVTLVAVCLLLLLVGYVSTWLAVSRATGEKLIHWRTAERMRPVFVPILAYSQADYPGAESLRSLWWSANPMLSQNELGATVLTMTDAIGLAPPDSTGMPCPPGFRVGGSVSPAMPASRFAAGADVSVR
jgi:hypothetical protein